MLDLELAALLGNVESDRVERKRSAADMKKIRQAVCAFSNDLPNHRLPGVVFVGVEDDGACSGLEITDDLLLKLSTVRDHGDILPPPLVTVQERIIDGCRVAVVVVEPAARPPVRYDGRTWIRVGPRRGVATMEEESRLAERSNARALPFDVQSCPGATLEDLNLRRFEEEYLPTAVAADVLAENRRTTEQQLTSLRLATAEAPLQPTNVGVLVLCDDPRRFLPASYIQFLRIDGTELTDPILDQKELGGPMPDLLSKLTDVLEINIRTAADVTSAPTEIRRPDYPIRALEQLARNAVLHRTYDASHAPVRIYWFSDRIEIHSPGGPFGQVNRDNFGQPGVADYRNPHLAEALKNLGFVQRFGLGIALARQELEKNGNPPVEFDVQESNVLAVIRAAR